MYILCINICFLLGYSLFNTHARPCMHTLAHIYARKYVSAAHTFIYIIYHDLFIYELFCLIDLIKVAGVSNSF